MLLRHSGTACAHFLGRCGRCIEFGNHCLVVIESKHCSYSDIKRLVAWLVTISLLGSNQPAIPVSMATSFDLLKRCRLQCALPASRCILCDLSNLYFLVDTTAAMSGAICIELIVLLSYRPAPVYSCLPFRMTFHVLAHFCVVCTAAELSAVRSIGTSLVRIVQLTRPV